MHRDKKLEYFLRDIGMMPETDALTLAEGFLSEMLSGLRGEASSIRMLPTYLRPGVRPERGSSAAVIDAGGTNFRSAAVSFSDGGPVVSDLKQDAMPGSATPAAWSEFTGFAADRLMQFLPRESRMGMCFSYPASVTPQRDGLVLAMTKQVRLSGCEGRPVCADIASELSRRGYTPPRMVMLNDTVAAALGAAAVDTTPGDGFVGLIWGTGLNTCCELDAKKIPKLDAPFDGSMMINLESGGYSGLPLGEADRLLDDASNNHGEQLNEKCAGGAYFGELVRYTLLLASRKGFAVEPGRSLETPGSLTTAECFELARQGRGGAEEQIVRALARRAAMFVCSSLAAILELTGQGCDSGRPVGLAIEGGTFHRSGLLRPLLELELENSVGRIMGRHWKIATTPDVNLVGAAAAAMQG